MQRAPDSRAPHSCSSGRSARDGEHVASHLIFWDVDTQHDFMDASGKLYVPDAESIKPNLKRLTDYAHERGIRIIATADDHEPGHRELSSTPDFRETFPEHCMRGTPGAAKIAETALSAPVVVEPSPTPQEQLARLLHPRWECHSQALVRLFTIRSRRRHRCVSGPDGRGLVAGPRSLQS